MAEARTVAGMPWPTNPDRDEPVSIPLDTETVLRALLEVEPGSAEDDSEETPVPE